MPSVDSEMNSLIAAFKTPMINDNTNGWGPIFEPDQFKDLPYQKFSKSDKIGKVRCAQLVAFFHEQSKIQSDFQDCRLDRCQSYRQEELQPISTTVFGWQCWPIFLFPRRRRKSIHTCWHVQNRAHTISKDNKTTVSKRKFSFFLTHVYLTLSHS